MPSRSALLSSKVVTLHSAVTSLAAPSTSSHGGDIAGTRAVYSPRDGFVSIDGSAAITLAKPVILCGYLAAEDNWYDLATLAAAADVTVTATVGYGERVYDVGILDRLAVRSGTITGGNVTVKFRPIEDLG